MAPLDREALFATWDAITPAELHAAGSMKWTTYPGAIGAWLAETDLGAAPAVTAALHEAVDRAAFGYLPRAVSAEASSATAEWILERYGWKVPADRIHPVADMLYCFARCIEHYSAPGSAIVVPTPAYMPFLTVPALHGRAVVEVPMAADRGRAVLDLVAIDTALADGAGLVALSNPVNPLGRVFEFDELQALAEIVDRHGARVFADEVYAPVVFGDAHHIPYASVSEGAAGHTITAMSTSKGWGMSGLKSAQLITSNDADESIWQSLGWLPNLTASTLGVIAGTAAYRYGGPWLDATLQYLDINRRLLAEQLAEQLPEVGFVPPEGTTIAWLDLRALDLGENPAASLLDRVGLAVADGRTCGEGGAGHVRLVLATPRPVLEQIIDRLVAASRT